ncbi:MAG: V-type ATP synthase subunit E family protein, partial [Clostridia bacterium]|nr:V-type ATP synthase subunit E family protein [Clostridia bacterium]
EAFIQNIIDAAEAVAAANIGEANDTASQILGRAQRQVDKFIETNAQKADEKYADALKRSQVVSNLDVKKLVQGAKKKVIDKVFEEALEAIKADKKRYLALLEGMILSCCEDGDEVVPAMGEDKLITKKFVSDLSKKSGKSLKKSESEGDFKGGVMLSGKNYDKNLTLELELTLIREKLESKIDAILFGSKD